MHIFWTNHPYDKSKNGTKEHVASAFGEVAIGYAQAEYVQPARRGTPQWLEEMKARSAAVTHPDAHDTAVPFVNGVSWSIGKSFYGRPVIQRRTALETGQCDFNVIPAECPADIRKQYEGVVRQYLATLEANEREKAKAQASR
jgi:hypothetical protein